MTLVGRSGALDRALAPCYIPPDLEGPGVLGMGVTPWHTVRGSVRGRAAQPWVVCVSGNTGKANAPHPACAARAGLGG
jgi:hypothetical protein